MLVMRSIQNTSWFDRRTTGRRKDIPKDIPTTVLLITPACSIIFKTQLLQTLESTQYSTDKPFEGDETIVIVMKTIVKSSYFSVIFGSGLCLEICTLAEDNHMAMKDSVMNVA